MRWESHQVQKSPEKAFSEVGVRACEWPCGRRSFSNVLIYTCTTRTTRSAQVLSERARPISHTHQRRTERARHAACSATALSECVGDLELRPLRVHMMPKALGAGHIGPLQPSVRRVEDAMNHERIRRRRRPLRRTGRALGVEIWMGATATGCARGSHRIEGRTVSSRGVGHFYPQSERFGK